MTPKKKQPELIKEVITPEPKNELLEKLQKIMDPEVADQVYNGCNKDNKCIKAVVWVAMAESSLFKKCSNNNCFGIMERTSGGYRVKQFSSIAEGVKHFQELYKKNGREVREKSSQRIKGNYCTSGCTYWEANYNYGLTLLS